MGKNIYILNQEIGISKKKRDVKESYFPTINVVVVQLLSHVRFFCDPVDCSPARLLCPCDFPGKNSGVGCHFLLQGIFLTQGSNQCLLHWQVDSLPPSHQRSPINDVIVNFKNRFNAMIANHSGFVIARFPVFLKMLLCTNF